jgi:hypothetical protein
LPSNATGREEEPLELVANALVEVEDAPELIHSGSSRGDHGVVFPGFARCNGRTRGANCALNKYLALSDATRYSMEHRGIDDIASVLDDIATRLDEVKEDCGRLNQDTYEQMKQALDKATSAIDRLADRQSTPE